MSSTHPHAWEANLAELHSSKEKLAQWGKVHHDPWVREKLEALLDDHARCIEAYAHAAQMSEALPQLRRARRAAQLASDRHLARRPARWKVWQKPRWEREDALRWSRLEKALGAEDEARLSVPEAMQPVLAQRVSWLRSQVDAFEPVAKPAPEAAPVKDPAEFAKEVVERLRQKKSLLSAASPTRH